MINIILKLLKSKWVFSKPKKKKLLIYDRHSIKIAKYLFAIDDFEVLDVRGETLNVHVIFLTLLKSFLRDIKNNYKLNYINLVSPDIIFSSFTYNLSFFKLKNFYQTPTYICYASSNCDENFFLDCEEHYAKSKLKLKSDFLFIVGDYYRNKFLKFIDTEIVNVGSLMNNLFSEKKIQKEKKMVLFISQVYALNNNKINDYYKNKIDNEINIIHSLEKYCLKNNYELHIATRNSDKKKVQKFYKEKFGEGNWTIHPRLSDSTSYDLVNKSFLIIFTNSFLGLEALSRGKRCIAFPPEEFPIARFGKKFSSDGPFWSSSFNYEILEKYISSINNYNDKDWQSEVNKYIGDLIKFDLNNKILKNTLNNLKIEIKLN